MESKKYQEELTTEMHSTFNVDKETDIRNKVFSILSFVSYDDKQELEKYAQKFEVTMKDIDRNKPIYDQLKK